MKISQKKLELAVAIGFSIIILVLSSTKIGYIHMDSYRNLDMGIIPAVFAAMIGGYRVGIPVAILWAFTAYYNPASNLQIYGLLGLMINRTILVTVAYKAYMMCKKYWMYSPANVYRAIIVAVTVKATVANVMLLFLIKEQGTFVMMEWLHYSLQQYLLELALCTLAMAFLIKHLRQVHILNGIKRREKARAKAKAAQKL